MRFSSGFAVPSVVVTLSTVLLCSSTAMSQPTPTSSLPAVSVEAPKARQAVVPRQGPTTATSRHRASGSSTGQTASFAPGSPLARLAKLEKEARSCNGGCETSFKRGNEPWVGCSQSGGYFSTFSPTCTDTLTYRNYDHCWDTKTFLGWDRNRTWWYCTSLAAGKKFRQVAEVTRRR